MSTVILVAPNNNEVTVGSLAEFVELVFGQGYHPKTGSIDSNKAALHGSAAPSPDPASLIRLGDLQTPSSDAAAALRAAFVSAGPVAQATQVKTTADGVSLGAVVTPPAFSTLPALGSEAIIVRPDRTYQAFMGVGAALTDAAAYNLMVNMTSAQRTALLTELFGPTCGFSTVRIAFGWHSFSSVATPFSYDDMPSRTDTAMGTTSGSNVVTDTSCVAGDAGKALTHPNFNGSAFVGTVTPGTSFTVVTTPGGSTANNATATGSAAGQVTTPDPNLNTNWSLGPDSKYIVPVLQQILAINPNVRVIGGVWWHPQWMRIHGQAGAVSGFWATTATATDIQNFYLGTLGQYIANACQSYFNLGIPIYAVSPANEYNGAGATAYLTDADYQTVVSALGQALATLGLPTRIWGHDDHFSQAKHVSAYIPGNSNGGALLAVPAASQWVDAICWHSYTEQDGQTPPQPRPVGQIPNTVYTIDLVRRAYSDVEQHITEIRTFTIQTWAQAMSLIVGGSIVGGFRHGISSFTMWNLVLDQNGGPNQGSAGRNGVVNINSSTGAVTRNAEYWALRTVGSLVQRGARRINSSSPTFGAAGADLQSVAFLNPDNTVVVLCFNNTASAKTFQVVDGRSGQGFPVTLAGYEVSAFKWAGATTSGNTAQTLATPGAPTVTATGGAGQVTVNITAPTGLSAPVAAYQISRSTVSGQEKPLAVIAGTATSYVDTTGVSGTFYYTVTAVTAAGVGTPSAEVSGAATNGGAITTDAAGQALSPGNSTGSNYYHNVGSGPNRLLVVAVAVADATAGTSTITSVQANGVNLTPLADQPGTGGSALREVGLWYMVNPPVGATLIRATTSNASTPISIQAVTLFNVNQATPFRTPAMENSGATTSPSVSTTGGAASDVVLAAIHARATVAPAVAGGQTSLASGIAGTNVGVNLSSQPGGTGTVTSGFTFSPVDNQSVIAVAVVNG